MRKKNPLSTLPTDNLRSVTPIELGSLFVCVVCFLWKNNWYLNAVYDAQATVITSVLHGHALDLVFLSGMILLTLLASRLPGYTKKAIAFFLRIIACWYLADCVSVVDFATPLSSGYLLWAVSDIAANWSELGLYRTLLIVAALGFIFFGPRATAPTNVLPVLGAGALLSFGWSAARLETNQFSFETRLLGIGSILASEPVALGLEVDIRGPAAVVKKGKPSIRSVPFAESRRPIVLVFMESLSSVDMKTIMPNGNGFMPNLDRLTSEGRLFENFFANVSWSSGSYITTFRGVPLLRYPGGSKQPEYAFRRYPSLIRQFKEQGYRTEHVFGMPLSVYDLADVFFHLDFDQAHTAPPLPGLESAKTSFGGVEDRSIYHFILNRIDALKAENRTYFISTSTQTTHEPYVTPLNKRGSERDAFAYADRAFAEFYEELHKRDFFKDGILLVMGDHHRRAPIGAAESAYFGCTAHMRVPLLVFGKDVTPGIDSRMFQQNELLSKLHLVTQSEQELSSLVHFSDWYATSFSPWAKSEVVTQTTDGMSCASVSISKKKIRVDNLSAAEAQPFLSEVRSRLLESIKLKPKSKRKNKRKAQPQGPNGLDTPTATAAPR